MSHGQSDRIKNIILNHIVVIDMIIGCIFQAGMFPVVLVINNSKKIADKLLCN